MYKPRIADRLLTRKLAGKGAVLIEGPKWCGKTTQSAQIIVTLRAFNVLSIQDATVCHKDKKN
jgi:predicted AAA+ superfamily ATPase